MSEQPAPSPRPAVGELDLIDGAIASLRDGEEARALALLERHRVSYPDGKFAIERKGLRVLALCAAGRLEEGRAERQVLLRSERAAPILTRVRKACAEAPGRP